MTNKEFKIQAALGTLDSNHLEGRPYLLWLAWQNRKIKAAAEKLNRTRRTSET